MSAIPFLMPDGTSQASLENSRGGGEENVEAEQRQKREEEDGVFLFAW